MKKTVLIILTIATMGISVTGCGQSKATKDDNTQKVVATTLKVISPKEFKEKMSEGELIDVRTEKEFGLGHIKEAVNINYFDKNHLAKFAKFDKKKPVFIYCRSGRRSNILARELKQVGFEKIYDLQGGILAWQRSGFEIVK